MSGRPGGAGDGEPTDPGRATVALCRCGRSSTKPFCDGSHKSVDFRAPSEPDPPTVP
ncbi:CDGSH iron-sulfur domain-containing protein [Nonomuraea spiralis]|uniref:CDGSH iron-sulfur domain-containing protein n=1 Tax=Nonomuraea spiralis TaxID=46182 RepID=A0ABV5IGB5_9ACTN